MKTELWRILKRNVWLQTRLLKLYWIAPQTTKKASIGEATTRVSKEKIYDALIDLNIIKKEEISFIALFAEIWEKNTDQESTK
jgi:hypothetical protein